MGATLRQKIGAESLDVSAFLLGIQESLRGQKASMAPSNKSGPSRRS